jgi:CspA family cold shock protein
MRFDSAPRTPRPHLTNISATVKWYNPTKGFGFVQPSDGSPDAFLHASALQLFGESEVAEGAVITCDVAQGQKGPQVVAIHRIDAPPPGSRPSSRRDGPRRDGGLYGGARSYDDGWGAENNGATVEGTVKWFNPDKGFGFIALDQGGKDVFVHVKALERCGLSTLAPDQRVRVTTRAGLKGPEAQNISLI